MIQPLLQCPHRLETPQLLPLLLPLAVHIMSRELQLPLHPLVQPMLPLRCLLFCPLFCPLHLLGRLANEIGFLDPGKVLGKGANSALFLAASGYPVNMLETGQGLGRGFRIGRLRVIEITHTFTGADELQPVREAGETPDRIRNGVRRHAELTDSGKGSGEKGSISGPFNGFQHDPWAVSAAEGPALPSGRSGGEQMTICQFDMPGFAPAPAERQS